MVFKKLDLRNRWINKELTNISGDLGTLKKLDEFCWVNEDGELYPREEDNYIFNGLLGKYILIVQGNPWNIDDLDHVVICVSKLEEYSKDLINGYMSLTTGLTLTECKRFFLSQNLSPTIIHDEIFFWTLGSLTKEIIELTEKEYEEIGAALNSIAFMSTKFNPNDLPFKLKYKY